MALGENPEMHRSADVPRTDDSAKQPEQLLYNNILLAVDCDRPESRAKALPVALSLARCCSAVLALCTVVRDVVSLPPVVPE